MRSLVRALLLGVAAAFSIGAAPNWNTTVALTNGGHLLGNPDAKVKLVAFVSYTCPHCAHFQQEADGAIRLGYVQQGKVSYEIRHFIRDPVDLTAAMLTNCGAPARFFQNHAAIMLSQDKWARVFSSASKTQSGRWYNGEQAARRRAIASDFGFYAIMEGRGYRRTDLDRCLNDNAMAARMAETTRADAEKYGLTGTPSFLLNGAFLLATSDWSSLRLQIDARL